MHGVYLSSSQVVPVHFITSPPVTVVVMVMAMMVVVVIVVMIVVVLMVVVLGAKVIKCTVAKRDKTHAI